MIPGANRVLSHAGRELHIQAEDMGVEQACFEVRIYEQGGVLWRKRVSYSDIVARGLPKLELEEALRSALEKTLQTVEAAIVRGKLEIA